MSAQFVGASSQNLNAGAKVTDVPFTAGIWVLVTATTGGQYLWSLHDGGVNCWIDLQTSFGTAWSFDCTASGFGGVVSAAAGTVVANTWFFVIVRGISVTNRRIAVLNSVTGAASHAQNTTSKVMTGIITHNLGCLLGGSASNQGYATGNVAEYWITNTDIQEDGLQLQDATLRQLAYGGPFSIPHIGQNVIDYRSLRKSPVENDMVETYASPVIDPQKWTNTNAATVGPHPALPYWFARPGQKLQSLVI